MSWWNSIEKAGSISKIAYSALKTAQQKIDEALDINAATIQDIGGTTKATDDLGLTHGTDFVDDQLLPNPEVPLSFISTELQLNQSVESGLRRTQNSPQTSGTEGDGVAVLTTSSTKSAVSVNALPEEPYPAAPLYRASSVGSLTERKANSQCPSSFGSPTDTIIESLVSDPNPLSTSPEDVEDGSSIEVISCGNSNHEGSSLALLPTSDQLLAKSSAADPTKPTLPTVVKSTSRRRSLSPQANLFDALQTPASRPRGCTTPTEGFIRQHRRANSASQDYRYDINSPSRDDATCAYFRLSKNYADKKHLLSICEEKILQLSRENNQLRETNALLEEQLKVTKHHTDLSSLTAEYSQRLSSTEERLQSVLRERDQLKRSLSQAPRPVTNSHLAATNEGHVKQIADLEQQLVLKSEQIADLLREGEKMAQDQLKANNLVKKLRAASKEKQEQSSKQSKQLQAAQSSVQELQQTLATKEELLLDRSTKIIRLNQYVSQKDEEVTLLRKEINCDEQRIREQEEQISTLKSELEAAKGALDTSETNSRLQADSAEREQTAIAEAQLLREQLKSVRLELNASRKSQDECNLRRREEVTFFQNQLAEAKARLELLTEDAVLATQPALSQMAALHSMLESQTEAWRQTEENLNKKIMDAQQANFGLQATERVLRERLSTADKRVTELQCEVEEIRSESTRALRLVEESSSFRACTEKKELQLTQQLTMALNRAEKSEEDVTRLNLLLQEERTRYQEVLQTQNSPLPQRQQYFVQQDAARSGPATPLSEKLGSDDGDQTTVGKTAVVDTNLPVGEDTYSPNVHSPASTRASSSIPLNASNQPVLEYMQSRLRLREGECTELHNEVGRLRKTQEALLAEVASLLARAQRLACLAGEAVPPSEPSWLSARSGTDTDVADELQRRYDALLLLYGKVVEENSELRLDLADVKEMYKSNIDMLLKPS